MPSLMSGVYPVLFNHHHVPSYYNNTTPATHLSRGYGKIFLPHAPAIIPCECCTSETLHKASQHILTGHNMSLHITIHHDISLQTVCQQNISFAKCLTMHPRGYDPHTIQTSPHTVILLCSVIFILLYVCRKFSFFVDLKLVCS
jgi:hypothetical protein